MTSKKQDYLQLKVTQLILADNYHIFISFEGLLIMHVLNYDCKKQYINYKLSMEGNRAWKYHGTIWEATQDNLYLLFPIILHYILRASLVILTLSFFFFYHYLLTCSFIPQKVWISFSTQLLKTMKASQSSLISLKVQNNLRIINTAPDEIYRFKNIITTTKLVH